MIAGTLALLEEPADEPLEDYHAHGFDTLDVHETVQYLDGSTVQQGRAAGTVDGSQEKIHVTGGDVEIERVDVTERVWTEWVADVTDAGFIVSERTHGSDPEWPFDMIEARTGVHVTPAYISAGDFVSRRQRADALDDVWFAGTKEETDSDFEPDNAKMGYGDDALPHDAIQSDIGVGFWTEWEGQHVKGVIYNAGYLAIYQPDTWGIEHFARFVCDEILPVTARIDPDELEQSGQSELGDAAEDEGGEPA